MSAYQRCRIARCLDDVHSMGSVNLVVVVESARTLITHNSDDDTNTLHVPSLIAVGAALGAWTIRARVADI